MLNFNPKQKFANIQKFAQTHKITYMHRLTHFDELSERTVHAIVIAGVAMYTAFILYREYNGLG